VISLKISRKACSREEDEQRVDGAVVGGIIGTGVVTTGGGTGEAGTDGDRVGLLVGTTSTTGAEVTWTLGGGDDGAVGAGTGMEVARGGVEEEGLFVGADVVGAVGWVGMDMDMEPSRNRSNISMSRKDLIWSSLLLLLLLILRTGSSPLLNIPNVRRHVDSTLTGRSF
jgi:hypothetical protein